MRLTEAKCANILRNHPKTRCWLKSLPRNGKSWAGLQMLAKKYSENRQEEE